jgi:hypothetical protein
LTQSLIRIYDLKIIETRYICGQCHATVATAAHACVYCIRIHLHMTSKH